MTRFRPLFWPTVFTVPVMLLLLGLGFWQIERLFWKRELIVQRQAAVAAAATAVPQSSQEARADEFHHVTDEGVFLHDKEIFLGATSEAGRNGYQVLTPLKEPGGRIVFVNRGFISAELKDPAKRSAGQISGTVRVAGLLRLPPAEKPAWFLPDNRADLNYWFWIDLPAMAVADAARSGGPVLYRCRCDPKSGGLAEGWDHPPGTAERPSAICDHVVFPGGCFDRRLCPLSPPQRGIEMTPYQQLETRFRRIGAIEGAISMLHWDAAAMMPTGGAAARTEQLATLRGIAHQHLTVPELGDLLAAAETESDALDGVAVRQFAGDATTASTRCGVVEHARRGRVAGLFRMRGRMA